MIKSRWLVGGLALLMASAALAQNRPERYFGDEGALSPDAPRDYRVGTGERGSTNAGFASQLVYAGDATVKPNDGRTEKIVYYKWKRNPDGSIATPLVRDRFEIKKDPVSDTVLISPEQAIDLQDRLLTLPDGSPDVDANGVDDRTQSPAPRKFIASAPRNKLLVVDQGERRRRIEAGQPPEKTEMREVTIVERWVEAVPVYETQSLAVYPCCCYKNVSVLVRYDYIPKVKYRKEMRPVADYPAAEIVVDRGIILVAGKPAYTTQIPRLCEFTYGPGAKFEAPTVPLVTNVADLPDYATRSYDQKVADASTRTDAVYDPVTGQSEDYIVLADGTKIYPSDTKTGTTSAKIDTITEPFTVPLVAGSGPKDKNYGGITMPSGQLVTPLDVNPNDRGTTTFPGDKVQLQEQVAYKNDASANIYDFKTRPAK